MASEKRWAPYAPISTILRVIEHFKRRDVPERITATLLQQIGINSEALIQRIQGTLVFLGLMEKDGLTTREFKSLRYATDEQYQTVLRGILEAAYKDVFDVIDPTTATSIQLNNAFIPFSPGAQRPRMVALFLGLCQAAGFELATPVKQASTAPRKPRVTRTPERRREDSRGFGAGEDQHDHHRHTATIEQLRTDYIAVLMDVLREKAKNGEADTQLMERIEKLLQLNNA